MYKYFYRVTLTLNDPDPDECISLAFDFKTAANAIDFATMAYNACDIVKVKIDIITTENDTTNSPMWRE